MQLLDRTTLEPYILVPNCLCWFKSRIKIEGAIKKWFLMDFNKSMKCITLE